MSNENDICDITIWDYLIVSYYFDSFTEIIIQSQENVSTLI